MKSFLCSHWLGVGDVRGCISSCIFKLLLQPQVFRGSDATPTQPVLSPISISTQRRVNRRANWHDLTLTSWERVRSLSVCTKEKSCPHRCKAQDRYVGSGAIGATMVVPLFVTLVETNLVRPIFSSHFILLCAASLLDLFEHSSPCTTINCKRVCRSRTPQELNSIAISIQ